MIDVVLSPEAARYREQLRNGGMLPASAPVQAIEPPQSSAKEGKTKPAVRNAESVGRFKILNEFVDYSARLVDTTAQAAWLVLFRETKPNGSACISFGQIAGRIGVSRRTAMRAVQHLEDCKLLTVTKRGRLNEGPSTYKIHATPKHVRR